MADVSKTAEKLMTLDLKTTGSSTGSSSIPASPSEGKRSNCLCSPTTHAGSFRCRQHRKARGMRGSMSVGSKLSELSRASMSVGSKLCDLDEDEKPKAHHKIPIVSSDINRGPSTFLPV